MHFFRFKLNPSRSPQGFSCIALGVVYHPGRNSPAESDGQNLLNRITTAEATFPNCGFIIVGDFNRLNTSHLQNHIELKHHEISDKRTGYSRFVVNQHGWPFFNTREFSPVWPLRPRHSYCATQGKSTASAHHEIYHYKGYKRKQEVKPRPVPW